MSKAAKEILVMIEVVGVAIGKGPKFENAVAELVALNLVGNVTALDGLTYVNKKAAA